MNAYNFAKPVVLSKPETVDTYLAKLGLKQTELVAALERGLSARVNTSPNHPVTSRGQYFYGEAVSGLREILAPHGFTRMSIRNVELTTNGKVALYLCRGCDNTGLINGDPESRMKKGDFTCELMGLIQNNNPRQGKLHLEEKQMNFGFDISEAESIHLLPNQLGLDLWFLVYDLHKVDDSGREAIRAELSRPISYNYKNIVNSFSTRLILNTQDNNLLFSSNGEPQFTPDIEFDISKVG